ncbi:MAG TPA: right-handed parallel beta-helix repeat-containing protein [Gaiellaceae bacterium]
MVVKSWPAILLLCLSITGSASPAAAAGGPRVTYAGPTGNVSGPVTLTAKANGNGARIVAVTFVVDGVPRGSDTTPPYSLGLNPALIRGGRHTVRVVAVNNLGRRASSSVARIVTSGGDRPVEASPQAGLAEALRALRRGDVTVRLGPGRYRLNDVVLGTSARLVGSGPRTVISPSKPGYFAILVAKGKHVRIANLTVDGGGAGPGGGNAIAVFDGSRDVRLQRLRLRRVRQNGVTVWGSYSEVSVQDSVIDGGGTGNAGIFSLGSDKSRGTSVIRTRIRGFHTFGVLLGQKEYGRPSAALHDLALDNVIADIRDPARNACYKTASAPRCGTEEGGIWTGGVEAAIIGNTIVRARWDGIETVGSSTRTTIADNVVRGTRTGIYLEHETKNSVIARNVVTGSPAGINVEWWYGGVGSRNNTFTDNRIVGARRAGIFVGVGSDANRISRNVFVDGQRPAIQLQGSSGNVVQGNRGCGTNGTLVGETAGRRDDGSVATPRKNVLVDNASNATCGR